MNFESVECIFIASAGDNDAVNRYMCVCLYTSLSAAWTEIRVGAAVSSNIYPCTTYTHAAA